MTDTHDTHWKLGSKDAPYFQEKTKTGSQLTRKQTKTFGPKPIAGWGHGALIKAEVRFDDCCGNGHNSFAITGEIYIPGRRDCEACGCIHDEIAKHFPELAPFIKWHLCATDGPMHYVANTVYHAGDRDCHGLRKDEFRQLTDRKTGKPAWVLEIPSDYQTWGNLRTIDADECPAPVTFAYKPWGRTGEGKARELDAARNSAIWPDATDEELTAPDLKEKLLARLPALLEAFRADVESLGFTW
jgi:hypothetical protein